MNVTDTLPIIAQLAATIAGFSAIVALIDRNIGKDWAEVAYWRIGLLLRASLSVMLFSLLPFVLFGFGVKSELVWVLANVALSLWILSFFRYATVQGRKFAASSIFHPAMFFSLRGLMLVSVVTMITALFLPQMISPEGRFLSACTFMLLLATAMFAIIVQQIIAPKADADETSE